MTTPRPTDRAARLREAIRRKRRDGQAKSELPRLPGRPESEPAWVSELQHSLWLQHRLAPESAAYNLASAFRWGKPLDPDRLARAFQLVVNRHRLLRSGFEARGDSAVQVVLDQLPVQLEGLDLVGEGGLRAALVAAARRPFDLAAPPLIRLHHARDEVESADVVLLVLHHVLADERSLGTLWRDLATAYGDPGALAGDAPQFDDYAFWLRSERDPAVVAASREFWRAQLSPPPGNLELPFERMEAPSAGPDLSPDASPQGRLLRRSAATGLLTAVRSLARKAGTTPFAIYAFACRLLLQRYASERSFALATPAALRSHPAAAEMIGYFLNPVMLVFGAEEDVNVVTAIRTFGERLREALANGGAAFPELAAEFAPPVRDRDRHPLFQAMFVHLEAGDPPVFDDAPGRGVGMLDLAESKFDLTVFTAEQNGELELAVEYRTSRFEAHWMERLLEHLEVLLTSLTAGSDGGVAAATMLPAAERRWLAEVSSGPELIDAASAVEAPPEPLDTVVRGLPARIFARCQACPDSAAVVHDGDRTTFGELRVRGLAIAAALRAAGGRSADRVALFLERSPRMIEGVLGVHWAGATYVPLDPEYPAERTRLVLEDAGVTAVVTTSSLAPALPEGSWRVIECDRLAVPSTAEAVDPVFSPMSSAAYVLFTSGSTGRPKGVVISHDNLRRSTAARPQFYGRSPGRFLLLPSIAFDSSVAGLFWTLASGEPLVIPTAEELRDPARLVGLIAAAEVRTLLCVPSLYTHLLQVGPTQQLSGLDTVVVAGEACPRGLVALHHDRLPGVRLVNEYGPTEGTVWCTACELSASDAEGSGPIPIGRPIPGVRITVLDDRGHAVPPGVIGGAWVVGPTVAAGGYLDRDELTRERFVADADGTPRYRTGDRVMWYRDGRLAFFGREDDQIKLRGFRVEPGEVEAAMLAQPGVESAAVVLHERRGGGDQLVGFVAGTKTGEVDIRAGLGGLLPAHMVPTRVEALASLPLLPNGKIDRAALRELAARGPAGGRPTAPARPIIAPEEQVLLSLWKGILGRDEITLEDNFFELGGHSLAVVEMTTAIARDLGVTLAPAEVFERPTIAAIARRIRERPQPAQPFAHLFPIQPNGDGSPVLFCIPHFFSDCFAARFRGERPVYGLRGVGLRAEGNFGRWSTMDQLANELVDEVQRRFDGESFYLAGYSFGASMAAAMSRVMLARGLRVRALWLITPMPLDFMGRGPLRLQLDALREPVGELSGGARVRAWWHTNHPFTPRPYRRLWRRLGVANWRRVLRLTGRLRRALGLPLTPGILHADVRLDRFRLHSRFSPEDLQASTVIFNAEEPATDAAATWRPAFTGPLEIVPTPDPHLGGAAIEAAKSVILSRLGDVDG